MAISQEPLFVYRPCLPLLSWFPNKASAKHLREWLGMSDLQALGPRISMDCGNLKSARDLLDVVAEEVAKECAEGWVADPFDCTLWDKLSMSPRGKR